MIQPSAEEKGFIRAELRRLNLWSLALGIPGLALQVLSLPLYPILLGRTFPPTGPSPAGTVFALVQVLGAVLLISGLWFNARYKGRAGAWAFIGLLSCIGFIVLALIGKRCRHCGLTGSHVATECERCTAPV